MKFANTLLSGITLLLIMAVVELNVLIQDVEGLGADLCVITTQGE